MAAFMICLAFLVVGFGISNGFENEKINRAEKQLDQMKNIARSLNGTAKQRLVSEIEKVRNAAEEVKSKGVASRGRLQDAVRRLAGTFNTLREQGKITNNTFRQGQSRMTDFASILSSIPGLSDLISAIKNLISSLLNGGGNS